MQKKIAILGGSFNPVHYGHLLIAQSVYLTKQFDEVWLMPAGNPPFKPEDKVNNAERLYMTYLAVRKIPYLKVSTFECQKSETSYTYHTLSALRDKYPKSEFWWIIGYDNLFSVETWMEAEKLLSKERFVVVRRALEDSANAQEKLLYLREKYGFQSLEVENPIIQLSSAMIRERVKNEEPIDFMLPRKVKSFIENQGLYRADKLREAEETIDYTSLSETIKKDLRKVLTPNRYLHTLGVEAVAAELGERYQISKARLSVAALMHDYAKCMSAETKRKLCRKYGIAISPIEEKNLDLLHAKLGAYIAQERYNINDVEIIDAIYYHTTGKPAMSDFSKIIYIADAIEPGRGEMDYLVKARKLAKISLDETMLFLLEESLNFLKFKNRDIFPLTKEAYEYYKIYDTNN